MCVCVSHVLERELGARACHCSDVVNFGSYRDSWCVWVGPDFEWIWESKHDLLAVPRALASRVPNAIEHYRGFIEYVRRLRYIYDKPCMMHGRVLCERSARNL
jgi:hypothetical protein